MPDCSGCVSMGIVLCLFVYDNLYGHFPSIPPLHIDLDENTCHCLFLHFHNHLQYKCLTFVCSDIINFVNSGMWSCVCLCPLPVGVVLMDISEVHKKVHLEMEENVSTFSSLLCSALLSPLPLPLLSPHLKSPTCRLAECSFSKWKGSGVWQELEKRRKRRRRKGKRRKGRRRSKAIICLYCLRATGSEYLLLSLRSDRWQQQHKSVRTTHTSTGWRLTLDQPNLTVPLSSASWTYSLFVKCS